MNEFFVQIAQSAFVQNAQTRLFVLCKFAN